jgi:short-subunit dehydrogenase
MDIKDKSSTTFLTQKVVLDKIVIVTGASSGIGLAIAKLFYQQGAKLALVARSKDKLEALAKELAGSFVVAADMTKEDEIKNMVLAVKEHFGKIDILINNAGQGYDASVENTDVKVLRQIFELDFVGPFVAMQEVIPIMRAQGGGAIVNISSGTALMALPNMSAYSSIKRALVGLSLTAAQELKKDNIIVSVVYPYSTDTKFETNTIKGKEITADHPSGAGFTPPKADTAEYIAEKILEGIKSGQPQIFAHEWMEKRGK